MNDRCFALLKRITIAIPIIVGLYGAATNVGQSKQLLCERLAIRSLSCHHQTVYFFGLVTSTGESFNVQAAAVEAYHPKAEDWSYTAYRLALTGLTGKDFFYYKNNVQQAYSDLKLLNHLLSGSASALELRYEQPVLNDMLFLILLCIPICAGIIFLRIFIVAIFVSSSLLGLTSSTRSFRGGIEAIIKSIVVALLVLTASVTLWGAVTLLQSEQLHCKPTKSNSLYCEYRITYLFGIWSTRSEFNVQRAVVKENYSSSDDEPSYNLSLTTSEGKEICYGCYNLDVRQVYSNLNKFNARLNSRDRSTLDLNYEQSWTTQLLALIGRLTVVPLGLLMIGVGFVAPIVALLGNFIPQHERRSGCDLP